MQRIRAITFDLDDTLWAIGPVIERAEQHLWDWLVGHYPRIANHWNRDSLSELRNSMVRKHREQAHDLRYLRRAMLAEIASAAGYGAELVDPAFDVFDRARNTVELFPDVLPTLERLRSNYVLVAVTNGNANLETIGIRHLFDDIVTAAGAGVAKPAPAIFTAACLTAGAHAHEVVHVGDHPEIDIAGAQRSGLWATWINRNGTCWPAGLPPPDAVIAGIDELHDLLTPMVRTR